MPLPSPHLLAVLVGLYEEPERPANAVEYLKRYMGASIGADMDALKAENERLKAELESLQQQLAAAQQSLKLLQGGR